MKKLISLMCVIVTLCIFAVSCTPLPESKPQESGDTEFSVTFDADNGITIKPIKVKKGQKIPKPENPVKQSTETEEYEFEGWYLGEKLWNFESDVVNQNITLTAKWETKTISESSSSVDTFTVTFDSKGGTFIASQTLEKDEKVIKPENPVKQSTETEEYEFDGWYLDEKLWDFDNDIVSQDITLTAKWKTKTYTGDLPIRR